MRRHGPGPGQVLQFAIEVKGKKYWCGVPPRTRGLLDTLAWVLGEQNKHPVTEQPTPQFPPDMEAITKVAQEAKLAARKHSRHQYTAVQECLTWIDGSNSRRPPL